MPAPASALPATMEFCRVTCEPSRLRIPPPSEAAELPLSVLLATVSVLEKSLKTAPPLFAAELPKLVFSAPKRGFGVPLASWFRGELQEFLADTITAQSFLDAGFVRPEAVAGMLNDHLSGRADLQHPLFAILSLAIWHKHHA